MYRLDRNKPRGKFRLSFPDVSDFLKRDGFNFKSFVFEWLKSLLEAVGIVLLLFVFCWPLRINGRSMEPTFSSRDRVVISRMQVFFNSISADDVVVCKIIEEGEEIVILKRIVAVPGDKVEIIEGKVFINSKLLQEDYVYFDSDFYLDEVVLGDKQYFLMGDNRELSIDSRHVGSVNAENIIGRVILRWYPFYNFEFF